LQHVVHGAAKVQAVFVIAAARAFRALLPAEKRVPPSARPLDHHKPTSLLAKIAMAIIVAFTDPGDGEPLRHAVQRLAGPASRPAPDRQNQTERPSSR
jgi:hypothetical protein